jgi:hypothetical protein
LDLLDQSSSAPLRRSEPKNSAHSSRGNLLVTGVWLRSYRRLKTSKYHYCIAVNILRPPAYSGGQGFAFIGPAQWFGHRLVEGLDEVPDLRMTIIRGDENAAAADFAAPWPQDGGGAFLETRTAVAVQRAKAHSFQDVKNLVLSMLSHLLKKRHKDFHSDPLHAGFGQWHETGVASHQQFPTWPAGGYRRSRRSTSLELDLGCDATSAMTIVTSGL